MNKLQSCNISGSTILLISPANTVTTGTIKPVVEEMSRPRGINFFCKLDARTGMYLVPSHQNFFGGIQISTAIADCGCPTLLLAIENESELRHIFSHFNPANFLIQVGNEGTSYVLVIRHKSPNASFDVSIGVDRFGTAASVQIPILRFSISSQNCKFICENDDMRERFTPTELMKISSQSTGSVPTLPVSLIGNLILDRFEWFKSHDILFLCDIIDLPQNFCKMMPKLASTISDDLGTPDIQSRSALDAYSLFRDGRGLYEQYAISYDGDGCDF